MNCKLWEGILTEEFSTDESGDKTMKSLSQHQLHHPNFQMLAKYVKVLGSKGEKLVVMKQSKCWLRFQH
jgi:hypothetical protein